MKRFDVIQGGKQTVLPEIPVRYSFFRRAVAVFMSALCLMALVYWVITVLPSPQVQPEIQYGGLALLAISFLVALFASIDRVGTVVILGAESVRAQILGIFGSRQFDVRYDSISSVGYAGQGEAPTVLITDDAKKKFRLPGLLFKDKSVLIEVLQDRVLAARKSVADQIEFPAKFRALWQGWLAVCAMLAGGAGIVVFNIVMKRQNYFELALAGAMFSMVVAFALLGAAPFATYSVDNRRIRRRVWLRPDLLRTIDLRDAKSYSITLGPRRKLHLFDQHGAHLMTFEISAYDFSTLTFWSARALEKRDR